MGRFAAFDIGTNTVLMVAAEKDAGGRFTPQLDRGDIARLGEGVDRTRRLSREAMERTVAIIERFAAEARALGVTDFAAGATSAARDAENREDFVRLCRERTGIDVRIIPGEHEALLTFRAVQQDFGAQGSELVAIDIGGGSTEIVIGPAQGTPSFRQSVNVGSVRLTEREEIRHPIPPEKQQALRALIREVLRGVPGLRSDALVVSVAATATTLYAIHAGLESLADPRVHGGELTVETLETLLPRLAALTLEELKAMRGLDPRRADVVCAGGFILLETLKHLGARGCRVSDRGVRYGLLYETFGRPAWR